MRLLELTDIVPIHNDNRYNTYNYEVSTIMSYVASRGYNTFILDPYYSNGGYWIRMFNIVVDNGAIYLLDFNPNVDYNRAGFYGDSAGYNRPVVAQSASQLGDTSMGISWTYESYQDRMYYTFQDSVSSMYGLEFAFYTTAQYTKVYVNNEDVTPVTYEWSSVPAISGKNGILSLTKILNINDGEPVQDITNRGNLDFSKKTKVNTLVNSVYEPTYKEDQTKASVEYEIHEAEYQYTKLVYKKKKIPKSANDGTAIDIGADDTEVIVTNLEPSTVYYFVVFTNRTKSNAYKFRTGSYIAPEGIFKLKVTVDKALLDNDFKDFISYEKVT